MSPWLPDPVRKDIVTIQDGRQGFINLDAFGGTARNNTAVVEPNASYRNYATAGYGRNELVYSCIRYRAESLPQAVLRVYPAAGNRPAMEQHRLRQLFANPNPVCNEFEFFELTSTYKDIAGTAFWMFVNGRDGLPTEVWPLRPDLVGVRPSQSNLADYNWVYRPDPNRPEVTADIPDAGSPRAKKSPVFMVRIRYPNPNPDDPGWRYFGQPPLRAAARATTLDNGATDYVDSLLRNHAVPSVVVETEQEITRSLFDRLKAIWKEAFGGMQRGTPAFLQKGMTVHELGFTPDQLKFPDLSGITETRICMAFGVEPILVGAKEGLEHNAYKDYAEARRAFWEEAMLSDMRRYIEPVRSFVVPRFVGTGRTSIRVDWDYSGVPALKEAAGATWERATKAFVAGGITRNDFRQLVGLPSVPNGDVFLTPAGVIPQPVGEDPSAIATSATAKAGMVAAEFGIELSPDELAVLASKMEQE